MSEIIEHSGVVECVEGATVRVRIVAGSACGSCKARSACGMSESQEKIVEVLTDDAASYAAGDAVRVGVFRHAAGVAVALGYVGALAVLVAVLVAGIEAFGWSEGRSALAAVGGVALYYGLIWLFRRKIENTIHFTITKQ
ncbi:MAG: SoxR reducing system RseC family protein [Alistipes sp.]|nr:SoxR reducing system RseC family protein [Alistipes sp.]MDE6778797.1 SoxR reducing system RseC family protein [Alistipes sp.]